MRIKTTETKVYKFDELSQEAKDRAINDMIRFEIEVTPYDELSDNFKKAVDKAEEMRTPWFTGSYVYEYCLPEIIETIKANEYEFTEDGHLA
jgi:hypothetical protein